MFDISLPLIISTFGIIFFAELPDKSALAALVLATRYRARDVILGTGLAFFVQTIIALIAGSFLTLLPQEPVRIAAGIGFLIFAFFAFRRKEEELEQKEEEEVKRAKRQKPVWLTSFLVIFAAEWGDLTQLATAALVAQNGHVLSIGIGATLALWAVTLVAAFAGTQLNKIVTPQQLNVISGVLFAGIGIFIIGSTLLSH
jgi:putative Ca2+/H+ antiporter (TMEM165/GDT1 family)